VADLKMLLKLARATPEQEKILSARLPGPYTFILPPRKSMPVANGNVGFRLPNHWCCRISKFLGRPITATSSNIHNQTTPASIKELEKIFGDKVALYIDAGPLSGKPSQVVDLTTAEPTTVRE